MIKFLCAFFLIAFSVQLYGQDKLDLISVNTRFKPMNTSSEKSNGFEEKGLNVNVRLPIVIKDKGIFYTELNTMHYEIDAEPSQVTNFPLGTAISGFLLRTGYIMNISKDRTIDFFLMPRFMTDFNSMNSYHFQMGGIISFSKKFSENFNLRLGMIYNKEKFGDFFNPLVAMYWKIKPRLTFTCSLPFVTRLTYELNEKSSFGVYHLSPVTSYALGEFEDQYLVRNVIDAGVFYRQQLKGDFYIEGRFGKNLSHTYDIYEKRSQIDWKFVVLESNETQPIRGTQEGQYLFAEIKFIYSIDLN